MKIKKKDLLEIIDTNGELIGKNDIPTSGSDMETQANNTTDYNQRVGTQPYRYDMLGRFGMGFLPFYEGKESQEQLELVNDLAKLMYDKYMSTIEHYYRNPNKLKSDFRVMSEKDFESQPEDRKKIDIRLAGEIMKIVQLHFEKAFKPENIDEATVVEDKMIDKKTEDEISNKSEDKGVQEKKLEKIAGLINKLDKKDVNKLINLIEAKKEETNFSDEEKQKIEDFVLNYKGDFKDEDIHKLGEKLSLDIPEVEEFIYNMARKELKK